MHLTAHGGLPYFHCSAPWILNIWELNGQLGYARLHVHTRVFAVVDNPRCICHASQAKQA